MNLIKLRIRGSRAFWRLGTLLLTDREPVSGSIDIDRLLPIQKEIINKSIRYGEINLLDLEENVISGDLNSIKNIIVSTNIIPGQEQEDDIPEINCVTVADEVEEVKLSPKAIEEAKIILTKNGHTTKKIITALSDTEILNACYAQEKSGRSRKNILDLIKNRLLEVA